MSPSVNSAYAQWLAQLHSMQEAIAELKMGKQDGSTEEYGHDIVISDDDLTGESGSDDIWDLISDEEEDEYSSDYPEYDGAVYSNGVGDGNKYDQNWLQDKCSKISSGKAGLGGADLTEQILAMLASDSKGTLSV